MVCQHLILADDLPGFPILRNALEVLLQFGRGFVDLDEDSERLLGHPDDSPGFPYRALVGLSIERLLR